MVLLLMLLLSLLALLALLVLPLPMPVLLLPSVSGHPTVVPVVFGGGRQAGKQYVR